MSRSDSAHAVLGTPRLPLKDSVKAMSCLADAWKALHHSSALFQVEEVESVPGVQVRVCWARISPLAVAPAVSPPATAQPLTKEAAAQLNRELPLALAAYIADDDELAEELRKSGARVASNRPAL